MASTWPSSTLHPHQPSPAAVRSSLTREGTASIPARGSSRLVPSACHTIGV